MRRGQVSISKHCRTAILWEYQSPSKKNNTTSNSTSHGQEVRNLAKVPYCQCTCPSRSAHLLGTFGHGNVSIPLLRAQNYSIIRLLTLRENLMEYHEEHRSWSTCREQHLFAIFEMSSFLSTLPSRNKFSSSDLCIFRLLSSTKPVPMYLVTCWKYKQTHIFISSCRNEFFTQDLPKKMKFPFFFLFVDVFFALSVKNWCQNSHSFPLPGNNTRLMKYCVHEDVWINYMWDTGKQGRSVSQAHLLHRTASIVVS